MSCSSAPDQVDRAGSARRAVSVWSGLWTVWRRKGDGHGEVRCKAGLCDEPL